MPSYSILIVDDEEIQAGVLGDILAHEGLEVTTQTNAEQALSIAQDRSFDLVLCDLKMPAMDGIDFLQRVRRGHPDLAVIIMTAYGTIETAVRAMREGAVDYVMKPLSKDELVMTIQRVLKHQDVLRENAYLKDELGLHHSEVPLVGTSAVMQELYRIVSKVAQDDKATVLLQGETGTGKEVVARLIHQMGPRRDAAFVAINCAAIPEGLMESEFFGHEKGAFTGAISARAGRFELAHHGTLFLDEVGDLDGLLQGKLLRVLQTREFERVGGTRTQLVDVRILAATNKHLQDEVRAGRFREDLFYRLNIVPLTLPPLRERREDIPALTEHILLKLQADGRKRTRLSPEAMGVLMGHDFPGNVRELENLLERALILSDGTVITPAALHLDAASGRSSLPTDRDNPPSASSLLAIGREAAEQAEKRALLHALKECNWNRVKAAHTLKIDYKTLRLKIRRYGLTPGTEEEQEP